MHSIGIKVVKRDAGYFVADDCKYPLHVTPALEGITIKFDTTVPMVVTDVLGRQLGVKFSDRIESVYDLGDPTAELTEFSVGPESMFWFVVAGVPEKEI